MEKKTNYLGFTIFMIVLIVVLTLVLAIWEPNGESIDIDEGTTVEEECIQTLIGQDYNVSLNVTFTGIGCEELRTVCNNREDCWEASTSPVYVCQCLARGE